MLTATFTRVLAKPAFEQRAKLIVNTVRFGCRIHNMVKIVRPVLRRVSDNHHPTLRQIVGLAIELQDRLTLGVQHHVKDRLLWSPREILSQTPLDEFSSQSLKSGATTKAF